VLSAVLFACHAWCCELQSKALAEEVEKHARTKHDLVSALCRPQGPLKRLQ